MKKLQLQVLEARSLLPSDINGYSDPYAIIYFVTGEKQKKIGTTDYLPRTLNPCWEYTISKVLNIDQMDSILIKIYDNDAAQDQCLGATKVELEPFLDGLWSEKWYPLYDETLEQLIRGSILLRIQVLEPDADSFRDEHRRPNEVEEIPKRYQSIRIIGDQEIIIPKPVETYLTQQGETSTPQ